MLRPILIGTCLAALLGGCATQGPPRQSASATSTMGGATCLSSDTRLPRSPGPCGAFGRSYSGDDLQRTGELNPGDALQRLDPAVTVQHH